jgi:hypothetical protein
MRLVCIDPGKRSGYAVAVRGLLVSVGTSAPEALPGGSLAVIEHPRVYPTADKQRDPQSIVKLAVTCGQIASSYPAFLWVEPVRWRGGAPESIVRERTYSRLQPAERAIVDSSRVSAHAWDALGIFVWVMCRAL